MRKTTNADPNSLGSELRVLALNRILKWLQPVITSTGTGISLKKKTDDKIIKEQQKTQFAVLLQPLLLESYQHLAQEI